MSWTLLTNHGHVLLCLASNPDLRISELADLVGIGERAAQNIVNDLVEAHYVTRTRRGRRNRYVVHRDLPLRHPLESGNSIGALVAALTAQHPAAPAAPDPAETSQDRP